MAEEASPRPSSPASTMEPLEMGAEIPAPRMRKDSVLVYVAEESSGHVAYVPQRIKLDSPRWREAMVDSGMEMRQLGEQPLLGPYGTKNANKSVLRRRKTAWEKLDTNCNGSLCLTEFSQGLQSRKTKFSRIKLVFCLAKKHATLS